jgi:hypothetical protein
VLVLPRLPEFPASLPPLDLVPVSAGEFPQVTDLAEPGRGSLLGALPAGGAEGAAGSVMLLPDPRLERGDV